jgi:hypothetical protein
MKQEWTREEYIVCSTRNERSGLAWFKTGIWKLRGMKGFEKGRCPYVARMKMLYICMYLLGFSFNKLILGYKIIKFIGFMFQ